MSFGSLILMSLRWAVSIGSKLIRVAPGYTFSVIIFTLISQVSMLLAFFLPLKVIILLGSSRIPRYFPESWKSFDHDQLVITLAVAAAGGHPKSERAGVFWRARVWSRGSRNGTGQPLRA